MDVTRVNAAERGYGNNVVRGFLIATAFDKQLLKMASTRCDETVALSMSPGDQDSLVDFLTDYFGSAETEELGKNINKIIDK